MLPHPPEFVIQSILTAQPDPYLWLFEVTNPEGGPVVDTTGSQVVLRLTPNPVPVQFEADNAGASLTWDPYPIQFGELSRDGSGAVTGIELQASNAAATLMAMLEANDYLRDHRVRMILVHSNYLSDPAMKAEILATVTDVTATWTGATFTLSAYDMVSFEVPQSLATPHTCRWRYRGKGCDFIGDPGNVELGDCAKDLAACKARGTWESDNGLTVLHPRRFGGFPGLPTGTPLVSA